MERFYYLIDFGSATEVFSKGFSNSPSTLRCDSYSVRNVTDICEQHEKTPNEPSEHQNDMPAFQSIHPFLHESVSPITEIHPLLVFPRQPTKQVFLFLIKPTDRPPW